MLTNKQKNHILDLEDIYSTTIFSGSILDKKNSSVYWMINGKTSCTSELINKIFLFSIIIGLETRPSSMIPRGNSIEVCSMELTSVLKICIF
jgi:hypothetical protein